MQVPDSQINPSVQAPQISPQISPQVVEVDAQVSVQALSSMHTPDPLQLWFSPQVQVEPQPSLTLQTLLSQEGVHPLSGTQYPDWQVLPAAQLPQDSPHTSPHCCPVLAQVSLQASVQMPLVHT
jgi:hypothetical protein